MANTYRAFNISGTAGGSDDRRVKVSIDDTTPAFLEDNIAAGSTKVTVATINPGADEYVSIDVDETNIDHDNLTNYDVAQHRIINDAGTSTTELWSASKINTALEAQNEASEISYDNSTSGLAATDLQASTDEIEARTDALEIDSHTHSNKAVLDATTASFLTADETKLDGIETAATADQTGAEIKVAYEAEADTNAYTDAEKTKLGGIETAATADQTDAEIKTAYENNADTNEFSDAEQTKLAGIETAATADQTGAEIKIAYEGEADTNAYTDAEVTKLGGIETAATADQTDAEIKTAYENNADTNEFSDAEQTKLAGISAGSSGDLTETSYAGVADVATSVPVTTLAFANGVVRSFDAIVSVAVVATGDLYEEFNLRGIQKGADWDMSVTSDGDDSLVSFDITAAGQVTYSKTTTAGWVSTAIKFRAYITSI